MSIGEVAARAGVKASALRFYEGEGLIHAARADSGHRRLLADHLELVEDVVVEHLFHDGRLDRHPPTPEARRSGDIVVYDVGAATPLFDPPA